VPPSTAVKATTPEVTVNSSLLKAATPFTLSVASAIEYVIVPLLSPTLIPLPEAANVALAPLVIAVEVDPSVTLNEV
jgi:hypothetical protein